MAATKKQQHQGQVQFVVCLTLPSSLLLLWWWLGWDGENWDPKTRVAVEIKLLVSGTVKAPADVAHARVTIWRRMGQRWHQETRGKKPRRCSAAVFERRMTQQLPSLLFRSVPWLKRSAVSVVGGGLICLMIPYRKRCFRLLFGCLINTRGNTRVLFICSSDSCRRTTRK